MIKHLLRKPLPQEVVALLEKIDAIETRDDSSYHRAMAIVHGGKFTRYERALLRNALGKIMRRETLHEAMEVVINAPSQEGVTLGSPYLKDDWVGRVDRAPKVSIATGIRDYIEARLMMRAKEHEHRREMKALERAQIEQNIRIREFEFEKAKAEHMAKSGPRVSSKVEQRAYFTIKELNDKFK